MTFTQPTIDWALLLPILIVLGAGVIGVLIEAFVPSRRRRPVQVTLTLVALVAALVSVAIFWSNDKVNAQTYAPAVGGYGLLGPVFAGTGAVGSGLTVGSTELVQPSADGTTPVSLLGEQYVVDPLSVAAQAIILILAVIAILVIADRTRAKQDAFAPTGSAVPGSGYEELARRKGLQQTEVFPLILFAVGGMLIFPATSNLLVMFVALEVLSLPLYVLTGLARRRRLLSLEAAFKYFVLGAFASAFFIFGVALLYGATGSVNLMTIGLTAQSTDFPNGVTSFEGRALLITGLLLVLVGLLFKVGAAPFHMWTPDVYQGAPTPITGFMAACTKVAAFVALMRVLYGVLWFASKQVSDQLHVALWIVAILTMVIGTVIAVVQTDMKRMLAYSSIAHAGFILVGITGFKVLATGDASVNLFKTSVGATLFYLLAYGLATVGAFAIVSLVRERAVVKAAEPVLATVGAAAAGTSGPVEATSTAAGNAGTESDAPEDAAAQNDGRGDESVADEDSHDEEILLGEATHVTQWAGLGRSHPVIAGVFSLFLLSMAGIPLTAGFVGKFGAFSAAVEGGAWPLALVGVLASAVAVFFYARIIVLMYFTKPAEDGATTVTVAKPVGFATVAIGLCAFGILFLGIFPSWVLDLAQQAARFLP